VPLDREEDHDAGRQDGMTRIGLISDLHGNVPALEAVLAELAREGVDEVVCLGDIAIGPQPVETVERLQNLRCPVTMGNWDAWFVGPMPFLEGHLGRVLIDLRNWSAAKLEPAQLQFIQGFVPVVELPLDSAGSLVAFHGSPRSNEDSILSTTSDAELGEMLAGRTEPLLVGGHTHFQLFRRYGESVVMNPGSVGLPFRKHQPGVMRVAPWAEYAVVSAERGRLTVDLRRTPYDVHAFLDAMRRSGMPHTEWWTELWSDEAPATGGRRDAT
jgi:predicted phosphodiesterase